MRMKTGRYGDPTPEEVKEMYDNNPDEFFKLVTRELRYNDIDVATEMSDGRLGMVYCNKYCAFADGVDDEDKLVDVDPEFHFNELVMIDIEHDEEVWVMEFGRLCDICEGEYHYPYQVEKIDDKDLEEIIKESVKEAQDEDSCEVCTCRKS